MNQRLKFLITFSVLLNLLMAGIIAGHMGRYAMGSHHSLDDVAMSLPADKRQHFEDILQRAQQDTGEWHEQASEARKKAANILKSEPFDKAAYLAQMQTVQQLHTQIMQRMTDAITQLAAQCTPEERAMLADTLRRPRHPADD